MRAKLQQVIFEARIGGADDLESFIRRAAGIEEAEVGAAAEFADEIIRTLPDLLAELREEAHRHGVALLVSPLLDHAEGYFLDPMDHAPEAAFGLAGLLDDAYLALRLVDVVQQSLRPLVRADVAARLSFLRRVLAPELIAELDAEAGQAILNMALAVSTLRERAICSDSTPDAEPGHG